jgi:hypothetical protein
MSKGTVWFAPRIWFDEVERIGMQRCTPIGYAINVVGGLFWFLAILEVPAIPVYLVYRGIVGTFDYSLLWLLIAPFVTLFVGSYLIGQSWALANRRDFNYDYQRRESTWIRNGVSRSYTFDDLQTENGSRNG